MLKVAVIVNENEVSHSNYADSTNMLRNALLKTNLNGELGNTFEFIEFDKFNITTLFYDDNINAFDMLFISTILKPQRPYCFCSFHCPVILLFLLLLFLLRLTSNLTLLFIYSQ
jgi:hypothetical protein